MGPRKIICMGSHGSNTNLKLPWHMIYWWFVHNNFYTYLYYVSKAMINLFPQGLWSLSMFHLFTTSTVNSCKCNGSNRVLHFITFFQLFNKFQLKSPLSLPDIKLITVSLQKNTSKKERCHKMSLFSCQTTL